MASKEMSARERARAENDKKRNSGEENEIDANEIKNPFDDRKKDVHLFNSISFLFFKDMAHLILSFLLKFPKY